MIHVISLGGSIIVPNEVDTDYLRRLRDVSVRFVTETDGRLIFVTGGGAPARQYQKAYRDVAGEHADEEEQDWIGIAATRLNAELLRAIFRTHCSAAVVGDPTKPPAFDSRIMIAAGWKPGFSTDYDAVLLAEQFDADAVINLSDVDRVYTSDPRTDPDAEALDSVSWEQFRNLVGGDWSPGSNLPFDPVASRRAASSGLKVIFAAGGNLENLGKILLGEPFVGTTIGPT